eukprot:sb/3461100/
MDCTGGEATNNIECANYKTSDLCMIAVVSADSCYTEPNMKISKEEKCNGKCFCPYCDDEVECSVDENTSIMERSVAESSVTDKETSETERLDDDEDEDEGAKVVAKNNKSGSLNCIHPVSGGNRIVPINWICDGVWDCRNGEDEQKDCLEDSFASCGSVNLTRQNRCGPEPLENGKFGEVCPANEFYNHYDCDIPEAHSTYLKGCPRNLNLNGVKTFNVSRNMVCSDRIASLRKDGNIDLCDNEIDIQCVTPTPGCTIHKHQLCDENDDCNNYDEDLNIICGEQTSKFKCERMFGIPGQKLAIPLAWIKDGVEDCYADDGIATDEHPEQSLFDKDDPDHEENVFVACTDRTNTSTRYVDNTADCDKLNTFRCYPENELLDMAYVCDRVDSCASEVKMCAESRNIQAVTAVVLETVGPEKRTEKRLGHCLPGLESMRKVFPHLGDCVEEPFHEPFEEPIDGVTVDYVIYPAIDDSIPCQGVFGEAYVYLACLGRCKNSNVSCPLKPLEVDSCPNLDDSYESVLASNGNGTTKVMAIQSKGEKKYVNSFFLCTETKNCVPYEKVCNLVDDCGDGSDENESICRNVFKCTNGDNIQINSKCDGNFDCTDYSDECNEQCSDNIIQQLSFLVFSFVIGILATGANGIIIIKFFTTFGNSKNASAIMNQLLVFFISIGDFCMGLYLIIIACYELKYRNSITEYEYCKKQFEWRTGIECSLLGVISTFGSQISLISMTFLSLSRVISLRNVLTPRSFNRKAGMKLALMTFFITLVSMLIATGPLFDIFEDFFVNGVYYPGSPIFTDAPDRTKHVAILEKYFQHSMKGASDFFTWARIRQTFTEDVFLSFSYGGQSSASVTGQKLHFYGNAGVCLFKFFVSKGDPQEKFIWGVLIANFVCFFIITISYIFINFVSASSGSGISNAATSKMVQKRNAKLQRKVSMIILTDFLCWMPLIFICIFHYTEVIDATSWYPFFSTFILPINSVINPLLYDSTVTEVFSKGIFAVEKRLCFGRLRRQRAISRTTMVTKDNEMDKDNIGSEREKNAGEAKKQNSEAVVDIEIHKSSDCDNPDTTPTAETCDKVKAENASDCGSIEAENASDCGSLEAENASDCGSIEAENTSVCGAIEIENTNDCGAIEAESASDCGAIEAKNASNCGAIEAENASNCGAIEAESASNCGAIEAESASNCGAIEAENANDCGAIEAENTNDCGAIEIENTNDCGAIEAESASGCGAIEAESASNCGAIEAENASDCGHTWKGSSTRCVAMDGRRDRRWDQCLTWFQTKQKAKQDG